VKRLRMVPICRFRLLIKPKAPSFLYRVIAAVAADAPVTIGPGQRAVGADRPGGRPSGVHRLAK